MADRFDAIIIGTGQSGPSLAARMTREGMKTAIIERKLFGGTCVNVGCIPTKTLVASARAAHMARRAADFGVAIDGPVAVDMAVTPDCEPSREEVVGSHVLLAVGRRPNTDDLGLDTAGVETDARGHIVVDDQLRTNVPGIWAIGEVNGRGRFTHTSYNDYEILAANMFDHDPRRVTDRSTAYGLFIDPPLGRVGLTEREVRTSGREALIGKMMMTRVGRARERGETDGFMNVLVDAETKRVLGAAILGIGGDEVVHSVLDVMYADAPYTVIQRAVHIHPTVTELIPTLLGDLKPLS